MYVGPCRYKNSADWLMDVDRLVDVIFFDKTLHKEAYNTLSHFKLVVEISLVSLLCSFLSIIVF